jgi:signal transduction histidine kinase/DNA-binding NarL/FixJ family response regulator
MSQSHTILVATDDPLLGDTVSSLLRNDGHVVITANSGDAALAAFSAAPPDAAVVDIALPPATGLDFTKRLRETALARYIPVIILSPPATRDDDTPSALHAGADDVLAVPFRHQELTLKLRRILDRQQWAVERQQVVDNLLQMAGSIETTMGIRRTEDDASRPAAREIGGGPASDDGTPPPARVTGGLARGRAEDIRKRTLDYLRSDSLEQGGQLMLKAALSRLSAAVKQSMVHNAPRPQSSNGSEPHETLYELDRLRAEFINAIVHDIRSPLGTIISTLELIELELEERRPNLSEIRNLSVGAQHVAQKLIGLVTELLDFSKLESGRMELHPSDIKVQDFLSLIVEEHAVAARRKEISLSYGCADGIPVIVADEDKLQRALANLISNAIKFTPKGGQVWIEARLVEGTQVDAGLHYLVVSVVDSGEGIPAQHLPYVFDPYYQANSRKGDLGTGLGLAIVKRIAAAHGGNVSVRSQVGVGSAFSIVLPMTPRPGSEPHRKVTPPELPLRTAAPAASDVGLDISSILIAPDAPSSPPSGETRPKLSSGEIAPNPAAQETPSAAFVS